MEVLTAIEITDWGDFDVKYTKYIMVADFSADVKRLKRDFCSELGLPLDGRGLNYSDLSTAAELFKFYLKKHGFKQLKTKSVGFSD